MAQCVQAFLLLLSFAVRPCWSQSNAPSGAQDSQSACEAACKELSSTIPQKLFPGTDDGLGFWSNQQLEVKPACRVEPESAEDVSHILGTAIRTKCHFAVKSGGHARDVHFSNADGGITIDLVRMNWVELSEDRKSVWVGAGTRWLDVYRKLEEHSLTVPGGRVADVGVGGLTLGGGISFFSNRHGWACDSVSSFDIVFPDLKIATVDQKSYPAIYRSLRGFGQLSFGIVTGFTYDVIDLPNPSGIWDGNRFYHWNRKTELMQKHQDYYMSSETLDTGGFNAFGYIPSYNLWGIADRYIHTTHRENSSWPAIFEPFQAVEAVPDTTSTLIKKVSDITVEIKGLNPYGYRNLFGTFSFRPSMPLNEEIIDIFREEAERIIPDVEEFKPFCVYHLLSKKTVSQMLKRGGSAISSFLVQADAPLVIVNIAWLWTRASDDDKVNDAFQRFMERAEAKAKSADAWHPFKYQNYAHHSQDMFQGFSKFGLAWLQKTQRKVDPEGVFTKDGLLRGGFLVNERSSAPQKAESHIKDEL